MTSPPTVPGLDDDRDPLGQVSRVSACVMTPSWLSAWWHWDIFAVLKSRICERCAVLSFSPLHPGFLPLRTSWAFLASSLPGLLSACQWSRSFHSPKGACPDGDGTWLSRELRSSDLCRVETLLGCRDLEQPGYNDSLFMLSMLVIDQKVSLCRSRSWHEAMPSHLCSSIIF